MARTDVDTLAKFYETMHSTIPIRRALTEDVLASRPAAPQGIESLRDVLDRLVAIPEEAAGRRLLLEGTRPIHVDLSYEIGELTTDLRFLEHGEDALREDFERRHQGFADEVEEGLDALQGSTFQALITDRDGTINNYCGRYASSVQSVYNAVYLSRFARRGARTTVVLTSAPLDGIGLVDLAVSPPGAVVMAGSKGREYFDRAGVRRTFPIDAGKQRQLDVLNDGIDALLAQPGYDVFTQVGSGLQHKFGQTTIARQDITGSIPAEHSEGFREQVSDLVRSIDPDGSLFRIEDTGLDLELILTIDDRDDGGARDFDKGDGVRFLNDDVGLDLANGVSLICGDTASDLPMLTASLELAPATKSVFVTRDAGLRDRVRGIHPDAVFVSEPDVLVSMLDRLGADEPG